MVTHIPMDDIKQIAKICDVLKKDGKKIGFVSGVFDIIHTGHIDYLEKAKRLCDILVVGIYSDKSVEKIKGKNRPVITELERKKILSAVKFVDYVIIFDKETEEVNIKILKPDYYIKTDDQEIEKNLLKIIKKIGAEIKSIPLTAKISTTDIIEKIIKKFCPVVIKHGKTRYISLKSIKPASAVFLDRDGTINEELSGYVYKPDLLKMLPNSIQALKKIQNMGYKIIIITAQQGIGLGFYSFDDFYRINNKMLNILSKHKIYVDKIYFCPHTVSQKCDCRKPNTALVMCARDELNIDLSKSFFIGDKTADIECGRRAGLKTILVRTGYGGKDKKYKVKPDYIVDDLLEAAEIIAKLKKESRVEHDT